MHARTHTHTHTHTHTRARAKTCTYTHTREHTHTNQHIHMHITKKGKLWNAPRRTCKGYGQNSDTTKAAALPTLTSSRKSNAIGLTTLVRSHTSGIWMSCPITTFVLNLRNLAAVHFMKHTVTHTHTHACIYAGWRRSFVLWILPMQRGLLCCPPHDRSGRQCLPNLSGRVLLQYIIRQARGEGGWTTYGTGAKVLA